jgi:uncharacterized protein (TIGR02996 family)
MMEQRQNANRGADMSDEDAFLRKILENPADDVTRLVYADWLQEHEEHAKSEFLRLTVEIDVVKKGTRGPIRQQLQELAAKLDTKWLAVVSKMFIENCESGGTRVGYAYVDDRSTYLCPKRWTDLQRTDADDVRFCTGCNKNVYYCDTLRVARERVAEQSCVVLDLGIPRKKQDLIPNMGVTPGFMTEEYLDRVAEWYRLDPVSEAREKAKQAESQ